MELSMGLLIGAGVVVCVVTLIGVLKKANEWVYVNSLGEMKHSLPPGDLGWPLLGTMWSFYKAFMYEHPDAYISGLVSRFGNTRVYKALLFGNPTVIVTSPEACKTVLMDDQCFGPGWPISVKKVMGKKGMHDVTIEEQRRLHRLTASPLTGHEALNGFVEQIKNIVTTSLEEWSSMKEPVEFLIEVKNIAFKVMMDVLISCENDPRLKALEKEYAVLNEGVISMPINLPGFACYKAIKARTKLIKIFDEILNERKAAIKNNQPRKKKDMLALMMEAVDDNGGKLSDEEIVDLLIIYLYAGHESSALATMWVLMLLEEHPQVFQKAKEEQEEIVRRRPPTQDGLTLKEVREMKYATKVIDETLRIINVAWAIFREARCDVTMDGYAVPKGWKVLAWIRNNHMDEKLYPNPKEFNPSRWDDFIPKAGTFMPFGGGSRFCPGRDLARLEISIFMHYYLLNYKFERVNPGCKVKYLPLTTPVDNCLARIKKVSATSA